MMLVEFNTHLLYYHNNGRTKMVTHSPAALEYEYYNFGLSQSEGFRPFPKRARAPPWFLVLNNSSIS